MFNKTRRTIEHIILYMHLRLVGTIKRARKLLGSYTPLSKALFQRKKEMDPYE